MTEREREKDNLIIILKQNIHEKQIIIHRLIDNLIYLNNELEATK